MNRTVFSLAMIFFWVLVTALWAEDFSVPSVKNSSGSKSQVIEKPDRGEVRSYDSEIHGHVTFSRWVSAIPP